MEQWFNLQIKKVTLFFKNSSSWCDQLFRMAWKCHLCGPSSSQMKWVIFSHLSSGWAKNIVNIYRLILQCWLTESLDCFLEQINKNLVVFKLVQYFSASFSLSSSQWLYTTHFQPHFNCLVAATLYQDRAAFLFFNHMFILYQPLCLSHFLILSLFITFQ